MSAIPVHRTEDDELLGYVQQQSAGWNCLTIFGYVFAVASTRQEAEDTVRRDGLKTLTGTWEYYDRQSKEWLLCIIVEASKSFVRVAPMSGYYPDTANTHLLTESLSTTLRK